METTSLATRIYAGLFLVLLGLILFFLISAWEKRSKLYDSLPTVAEMTHEMSQMEVSLMALSDKLTDKDMDMDMKDQLLEEKNIELAFMADKIAKLEAQQNAADEAVAQMKKQLAAARKMLREAYAMVESQRNSMGLVYRVQIGILDSVTLPTFPFDANMFLVEEEEGYLKYVLGSFRDYDASMEFRDLIRNLGVNDAWVVAYYDGERMEVGAAQAQATLNESEGTASITADNRE